MLRSLAGGQVRRSPRICCRKTADPAGPRARSCHTYRHLFLLVPPREASAPPPGTRISDHSAAGSLVPVVSFSSLLRIDDTSESNDNPERRLTPASPLRQAVSWCPPVPRRRCCERCAPTLAVPTIFLRRQAAARLRRSILWVRGMSSAWGSQAICASRVGRAALRGNRRISGAMPAPSPNPPKDITRD